MGSVTKIAENAADFMEGAAVAVRRMIEDGRRLDDAIVLVREGDALLLRRMHSEREEVVFVQMGMLQSALEIVTNGPEEFEPDAPETEGEDDGA